MLLQPPVKNIIVLFQKTTIPPPQNVLGNLEVGGGLKIQSFKTSQGVGRGEVSQPPPPKKKPFHGREMDNSCNEILQNDTEQ